MSKPASSSPYPLAVALALVLSACAPLPRDRSPEPTIELPLVAGWFEGQPVYYVTTDISNAGLAAAKGANYVPRLAEALPPLPRRPGRKSAVERIYGFGNFRQGSVLPSLPLPTGAGNADRNYSPLWELHKVNWLPGHTPRVLKSEEEVLRAEDAGEVSVKATGVVANCPVVYSVRGGLLPGARLHLPDSLK